MKKSKLSNNRKIAITVISVFVVFAIGFSCFGLFYLNRLSSGVNIPTAQELENNKVYDRVVIFGVDGAGAFFEDCDTPNFDRIYKNGSVTYNAVAQYPTNSAPNWASMLLGVRYNTHKISNDVSGEMKYLNSNIPSIFVEYQKTNKDADCVSIVNWDNINFGCIEDRDFITKINAGDTFDMHETHNADDTDRRVKDLAIDYITENDPDIMFLQFDTVDGAGHDSGYGSDKFEEKLKVIDGYIGEIYDAYCAKGWGENTLFITVSDHGHETWGGHGGNFDTVRHTTIAVAGGLGNIKQAKMGHAVTQDVCAIVAYGLGIPQNENWECSVPTNIFTTLK